MQMFLWNNIFLSLGFDVKDHFKDFGGDAAAYAAPVSADLMLSLILYSLQWFSQRRSQTPHFGGVHLGGYDRQIWTRPRLLYYASTPKFHHRMCTCLEVIMLTDKQTNRRCCKHPLFFAMLRHWVKSGSWNVWQLFGTGCILGAGYSKIGGK